MNAERKPELRVVRQAPTPTAELPHDEAREKALLGAILSESRVLDLVVDLVTPADFYDQQRALIFDAMIQIRAAGEIISLASVVSWLKDRGTLTAAGGPVNVAQLKELSPVLGQVTEHARRIALKAKRRALIQKCHETIGEAHGDVGDEAEFLDAKAKEFRKFGDNTRASTAVSLRVALDGFFQKLYALSDRQGAISGITTGLKELDALTAGWQGGEITLIGGETGLGKSAFAGCLAINAAESAQREIVDLDGEKTEVVVPTGVVIFSLEMPRWKLAQRVCCGLARVNFKLLEAGNGGPRDVEGLVGASEYLSNLPVIIDDESDLTMSRLEAKLSRIEEAFAARGIRLGLVLIDYFQLMIVDQDTNKNTNREQQLGKAARRLQQFASRFKARPRAIIQRNGVAVDAGRLEPSLVAFGVLTQLNDEGQVRESKGILQHAQNFWLLESTMAEPDGPGKTTRAPIRIKKQRDGDRNAVAHCWRHASYTLYTDQER